MKFCFRFLRYIYFVYIKVWLSGYSACYQNVPGSH